MPPMAAVPDLLARRIQALVAAGEYPSFQAAVEDLLLRGLESRTLPTPRRPLPPMPPGTRRDPGDLDRPIDVDPGRDVNWA